MLLALLAFLIIEWPSAAERQLRKES